MISVVVPVLDEAVVLPRLLASLGEVDEIVVVDGGSTDDTCALATAAGARVVRAARGRGAQLQAGVAAARGDRLWFLHADTEVPAGAVAALRAARAEWGCFAVEIGSADLRLRATGALMTLRARLTGSATGDMGIWAGRGLVERVGGWPALRAFEDLVFTDRARAVAAWEVLTPRLTTSARRWEARGITRTMAQMMVLRAAYRLGADPTRLAERYAGP